MSIQAVFFDMGGTIETYRHSPELRLRETPGIQQLLLAAGIDPGLTDRQLYETLSGGLNRYHRWSLETCTELSSYQVWRDYLLPGFSIDQARLEVHAEELMLYIDTHYYERALRPEIPAALAALQEMGLKIGLISNVHSRGQVPVNLTEYGIRPYFDPVILSCEYGRRKPDPAIFHYAARMAHIPTSRCAYVGDRVARDIAGARRAGFGLALQILHDFEHGEDDSGPTPDAIIHNMNELPGIIQARNEGEGSQPVSNKQRDGQPRAFLFDAGDILYYRPNRGARLRAFLQELSINMDDISLPAKQALVERAFVGEITQDEYRELLLRLYGVENCEQIERGKQVIEEEDKEVCFFAGVPETLAGLKQKGYYLGVITDTAHPVHDKLSWFEKGGFGDVWDSFISSPEMGVRKPHPKMYEAALQQLNLEACQAVFVGHKTSELSGARAVGMKTIAFNYDATAQADCFIEHFSNLLDVSEQLSYG